MWHIFIVVTMGAQMWQWKWMSSYSSVEDCNRAFIEEVWPQLRPKHGTHVQLVCSQEPPMLALDADGASKQ